MLDPTNLAQNTLQAVRSLISNANEVTQIQNQVRSLANEARQLVSLPLSLVNEIDAAIQGYTALLNQGRGMAYSLTSAVHQFESLYSGGFGGNTTFLQRAQRMLGQIREAGRLGTQATAIFERLCLQQERVGQLTAASQAAVGSLQAQQAGNQLQAVLAEQQISIQGILATDQRLKISQLMEEVVTREKAYENAQRYVQGLGLMVKPVAGPGVGGGVTLPE